ncbi:hypothetical protein [Cellulomonas cellasea]|uniref:Lipocalin-like domain-containing protein n=1 Tax=Cellulomonas cellasea TaxID=43670 RepID=A0A7W4UIA4_9CELL|nr:hypothetical protein [Cellulomonas cellasea]MBB2924334.1 hypothetical protein [Cellulomonas cellasea]
MRAVRPLVAPALVALALLVTGCSSGGDDAAASPTPTPEATVEETPTPTPTPTPLTGAACLVGSWDVDQASLAAGLQQTVAADGTVGEVQTAGATWISFDGTSTTLTYESQSLTVTMDVEGQQLGTTLAFTGPLSGAYTATDTELTVPAVDTSGVAQTLSFTLDGAPFEMPAEESGADEYQGIDLTGTQSYTCTEQELVLVSPAADGAPETQQLLRRRA